MKKYENYIHLNDNTECAKKKTLKVLHLFRINCIEKCKQQNVPNILHISVLSIHTKIGEIFVNVENILPNVKLLANRDKSTGRQRTRT